MYDLSPEIATFPLVFASGSRRKRLLGYLPQYHVRDARLDPVPAGPPPLSSPYQPHAVDTSGALFRGFGLARFLRRGAGYFPLEAQDVASFANRRLRAGVAARRGMDAPASRLPAELVFLWAHPISAPCRRPGAGWRPAGGVSRVVESQSLLVGRELECETTGCRKGRVEAAQRICADEGCESLGRVSSKERSQLPLYTLFDGSPGVGHGLAGVELVHYWSWLGTDGDFCRAILRVRGNTCCTIWRAMAAGCALPSRHHHSCLVLACGRILSAACDEGLLCNI